MDHQDHSIIEQHVEYIVGQIRDAILTKRTAQHFVAQISTTMPWSVDYKNRNHVFLWSPTFLSLTVEDYGLVNLQPNVWTQFDFPPGMRVYATNIITPVYMYIQTTDDYNFDNDPIINETSIAALAMGGQVFSSFTGNQTSAGAVTVGHALFNPSTSGRILVVYSIKVATAAGQQSKIIWVTTDPGLANTAAPVNHRLGSPITSLAHATFVNAADTTTGTALMGIGTGGNTLAEILTNNDVIVIPPGNGIDVQLSTSTNAWQSTISYRETV